MTQSKPIVLRTPDLPLEHFQDSVFGTVRWRTLFSADRTQTSDLTCGVAYLEPGDSLNLHRHDPAEVYFGLSGKACVIVDGVPNDLTPGVAVFVPAGAVHGVFAYDDSVSFFYTFAVSSFADVNYEILTNSIPSPHTPAWQPDPIEPAFDLYETPTDPDTDRPLLQ